MSAGQGSDTGVLRRPALSRDFIERERRRRFVRAAAASAAEAGVGEVTAATIVAAARSSRNTFYECFDSVGDCLRFGLGEADDLVLAPLREPAEEGEWLARTRDALSGVYERVAAEPLLARLLFIDAPWIEASSPGFDSLPGVEELTAILERGREEAARSGRPQPPPLAAELLARLAMSAAKLALAAGSVADLPAQAEAVAFQIGVTFLGIEETGRILGAVDRG